ncbi:MAG TPA: glycoside hydrolase family 2 TIM barrel-domain containing protein [Archangium sp.]|uniref:glycoside hydrolase family 2 protein n=1 Tax=Archangium sp. TaxID=1872627 RepID=UPI002ED8C76A
MMREGKQQLASNTVHTALALLVSVALALCATRASAQAGGPAPAPSPQAVAQVAVPRAEHPRPDFVRDDWRTLNGRWEFEFDDEDRGLAERWYAPGSHRFTKTIIVPFAFQTRLSGIGDTSMHDVVWYRRALDIPEAFRRGGRRLVLHFGAVDYEARVWVNGELAGAHRGGHVGFELDVTDLLKPEGNEVVVRVHDPSTDRTLPRGKQFWEPKSEGIWYTRTTGIWQPVWIESVDASHVLRLRVTPDVDNSRVAIEAVLNRPAPGSRLRTTVSLKGKLQAQSEVTSTNTRPLAVHKLTDQRLWSPWEPTLYDLTVELVAADGRVLDRVASYFGQRKVSTHEGRVYLNNYPYYLRLVLDQGYWPESLLTPPSDEAMLFDIRTAKAMGFNGARKHQKVEDPRWLYWADREGYFVWGEMANAQDYSDEYVARFTDEWQQVVARDYNHPSIIVWVPLNESWGVLEIFTHRQQQEHAKAMYYLLRSLDPTRLVIDNDGWEHTDATDLFALHDYARTGEELAAKYKILETDTTRIPRNARDALATSYRYNGSPLLLTEFGGIAYRAGGPRARNEWGYSGIEPTREALLKRLDGLVGAIVSNKAWAGFCYTQLTDVEQEINGLLTYDRKPKATPEELKKIFEQR